MNLQGKIAGLSKWLMPEKVGGFLINLLISAGVLFSVYILIKLLSFVLDRVLKDERQVDDKETAPFVKPIFSQNFIHYVKIFLKTLLLYGGYFTAIIIIFEVFDFNIVSAEDLKFIGISFLKIIGILVGAKLVINLGHLTIKQFFEQHEITEGLIENRKIRTLIALLRSVLTYVVFFIAGLMILGVFGVNTSAILASAGILGLAVGFGAQNIVKDVISGFFILFEDQFSVGDYVEAGGVVGTVEAIGLRTCRIREWTGQLHIIPNGEITKVKNYNRGTILALVVVGIAYEEDIDRAISVLQQESEKAYQEMEALVDVPQVHGVIELADSSVNIRTIAPCRPGGQWAVERELLRRFKYALDQAGIEIPYPRRVIYDRTAAETFKE